LKSKKFINNAAAGECSYCWDWCDEGTLVCPNSECPSRKEVIKELALFNKKKHLTAQEQSYYLELKRQYYNVIINDMRESGI